MKKIYKVSIISSFLGLWFVSFLDAYLQTFLGFFLIFTFGVFHGANDLLLFATIQTKKDFHFIKTLSLYIFVVLIAVVFFICWPAIALLIFIVISGFHFGQQQFEFVEEDCNSKILPFFYLIYGLFILFFLFLFNAAEVVEIVKEISSFVIDQKYIENSFFVLSFLLLLTTFWIFRKSDNFKKNLILEVFFIIVFGILFYSTTLIWGFALYFILWHSLPSIGSQIEFVYDEVNAHTISKYAKSGFLYWIVSMLGILILYYCFRNEKIFNSIFFSFLAAITFPHVIVIQKMFSSKK